MQGEGDLPPLERSEAGVERAERSGGLHKRSAEAWGNPLRARGAELPLGAFAVALQEIRAGVAGAGTRPLRNSLIKRNTRLAYANWYHTRIK